VRQQEEIGGEPGKKRNPAGGKRRNRGKGDQEVSSVGKVREEDYALYGGPCKHKVKPC